METFDILAVAKLASRWNLCNGSNQLAIRCFAFVECFLPFYSAKIQFSFFVKVVVFEICSANLVPCQKLKFPNKREMYSKI